MQEKIVDCELIRDFDKISKELICVVCQELVFHPKECDQCQKIYCKDCIEECKERYNKCPNCNYEGFNVKDIDRVKRNIILEQNLNCIKCNYSGQYNDFAEHNCCVPGTYINDAECGNCNVPMNLNFNPYPQYNGVWFCDKCKVYFKNKEIPLHCFTCKDFDYCMYCLEISDQVTRTKVKDENSCENCQNILILNETPYKQHPTHKGKWFCNNCNNIFQDKPSLQCQQCEYDLCLNCSQRATI